MENKNFSIKTEETIITNEETKKKTPQKTEITQKETETSSKDTKNPFLIQTNHIMNESLNDYVLKKTGQFPEKAIIDTSPNENTLEKTQKPSENNLFLANITPQSSNIQAIFNENPRTAPFGNVINAINAINPTINQINPINNQINPINQQINEINPINNPINPTTNPISNPFMNNNNTSTSLFMSPKTQNEPNLMHSPGFFPPNQMNNTNATGFFGNLMGNNNNSTPNFAGKSSGGIFGSLLENTNIFDFNKGSSNENLLGNNNDGLFGSQLFSDFANQNNINANNASMGFNKSSKKKKQRVHN